MHHKHTHTHLSISVQSTPTPTSLISSQPQHVTLSLNKYMYFTHSDSLLTDESLHTVSHIIISLPIALCRCSYIWWYFSLSGAQSLSLLLHLSFFFSVPTYQHNVTSGRDTSPRPSWTRCWRWPCTSPTAGSQLDVNLQNLGWRL